VDDVPMIAVLKERLDHIREEQARSDRQRDDDMAEIRARMKELVHIARFRPIEAAVYGLVLLLATGLVAILVNKIWGGA
jgi:hypothetical protein